MSSITPSRFFQVVQSQGFKFLIRDWLSAEIDSSDTMRLFPSRMLALIFGSGIELRGGGPVIRDISVYSFSDFSPSCHEEKLGTLDAVYEDSYHLTKNENYIAYIQHVSPAAQRSDTYAIGDFRLVIIRLSDRTKFVSRNSASQVPTYRLSDFNGDKFIFDDGTKTDLSEFECVGWA